MTRSAWTLAAMADAALPGLLPVGVAEVVDHVGDQFRVGFVDDAQGRRWVVRVPGDAVAAAQQDASMGLLALLAPRVPFAVPEPAGFAPLRDGRRAMIYPVLPGRPLAFDGLAPGCEFTSTLGRAIAALHDVDRALFEEAGVPVYDAADCQRRRQADVDRGAQTGLVPTGLLARWEGMLDDVAWWRFAPTPVHGRLDDRHLLAEFDDDDSATGRVTGMTSWQNAQIGDPAQDLAALVGRAGPGAVATVLEAYTGARTELPDAHLERRAGLLGELACLTDLLTARRLGDRRHVAHATQVLRELDARVDDGRRGGNRSGTSIDRLPVDFDPPPADRQWYRAGAGSGGASNDTGLGINSRGGDASHDDDAPRPEGSTAPIETTPDTVVATVPQPGRRTVDEPPGDLDANDTRPVGDRQASDPAGSHVAQGQAVDGSAGAGRVDSTDGPTDVAAPAPTQVEHRLARSRFPADGETGGPDVRTDQAEADRSRRFDTDTTDLAQTQVIPRIERPIAKGSPDVRRGARPSVTFDGHEESVGSHLPEGEDLHDGATPADGEGLHRQRPDGSAPTRPLAVVVDAAPRPAGHPDRRTTTDTSRRLTIRDRRTDPPPP